MTVSDFKKNSDRGRGIFYDDSYYYSFNFPSIALGNRTLLEYREVLKNPKFMTGFVFSTYMPQGRSSFTIKTTKDVELFFKILNDPNSKVTFKKTEKGSNVTYEWSAFDVPAYKIEDKSPSMRYTEPHVVCYVKSYQTKKGKVNMLGSLDQLYEWYHSFVKDLNKEESAELTKIVNDLKSRSKNETDLVKNVFYWVQENIQYIAFEQGMRGFIPHSGSYICEKRYGDCKDMANLIVNMLKIAGSKAHHTWIGTRDLPYRYSEVPTPLVDNHMIATYIDKNGNYYFLDATSDHTQFGFPSSMIQGKEALIAIDETKFEVKEVPVISMDKNVMTDSMKIRIENNVLVGEGKSSLNGFAKVFGGYELDRAEQNDVKKYVTKLLGKGNNKFYLDTYSIENLEDRDVPTSIKYAFRIGDYHQKIGEELFINLNLNKDLYNDYINISNRTTPVENEYQYVKYEDIEFSIPVGYTVEYIPENFSLDVGFAGCSISYQIKKDKVSYHKKFFLNFLLLHKEKFDEYNTAIKQISEAYKESIILKKK